MLAAAGIAGSTLIFTMALCGIFNGGGRIVFPWISDFFTERSKIWPIIAGVEVLLVAASLACPAFTPAAIVIINATYGAAFATLPSVLESKYGKDNLSQIHGFCLTSWGMASLFAYLCSTLVLGLLDAVWLFALLLAVYAVNVAVSLKVQQANRGNDAQDTLL